MLTLRRKPSKYLAVLLNDLYLKIIVRDQKFFITEFGCLEALKYEITGRRLIFQIPFHIFEVLCARYLRQTDSSFIEKNQELALSARSFECRYLLLTKEELDCVRPILLRK